MRCVAMLVLTVTFCLGLTDRGIAGPFGLSMGMKPSEVGGKLEKKQHPGVYEMKEVPKPHSAFESYSLKFGPKTGLCQIVAYGHVIETSVYGGELRMAFDQLEKRLEAQYRKHEKFDFLQGGAFGTSEKTL